MLSTYTDIAQITKNVIGASHFLSHQEVLVRAKQAYYHSRAFPVHN